MIDFFDAERYSKVNIKTPQEFDDSLQNEQYDAGIAGSSVCSLSQLEKGRESRGWAMKPWKQTQGNGVNLMVSDAVASALSFQIEYEEPVAEWLPALRGYAQSKWIIHELASEIGAKDETLQELSGFFPILLMRVQNSASLNNAMANAQEVVQNNDAIRSFFIRHDLERTVRAFFDARDRGGVQVIYGPQKEFIDFLKRNRAKHDDHRSVFIATAIPSTFVRTVIPLGAYEQRALMGR